MTEGPNPSRRDFCTTTADARCKALIARSLNGGRSKTWISGSPDLLEDGRALRVVRGPAARQDQLALHRPADQLVGPGDAERVLQAIEAGDLREDGPVVSDAQVRQHRFDFRRRHVAILLRQRVDGGVDHVLGNRKELRKLRRGEDGRVVPHDVFPEEIPDVGLGVRDVHMAAPDPLTPSARAATRGTGWGS